jgi:DNA-binding transcriptional LysR family regulator
MHAHDLDLNLLKLLHALMRSGSVTRAAVELKITQPAASQGLMRLRSLLEDPLFVRAGHGMRPTPKAERLWPAVRSAFATLDQALAEAMQFDPATSPRVFRIHMSDIGEGSFLPNLVTEVARRAPSVRIESLPVPVGEISAALDSGRIDFAVGFLPAVKDTQKIRLLRDKYILLVRSGHPFAARRRNAQTELGKLDFVAVRTHTASLRIL